MRALKAARGALDRLNKEVAELERQASKQKLTEAQVGALQEASMSMALAADTLWLSTEGNDELHGRA